MGCSEGGGISNGTAATMVVVAVGVVVWRSAPNGQCFSQARSVLAGQAKTPELRDRLIDLARIWMDAALTEEEAQERPARPSSPAPPPVNR
jgi:hypothetical protein